MSQDANPPPAENGEKQESRFVNKPSLIEWRRDMVLSMYASGKTMTAIAETLKVDISTVSRDILHIRQEAKKKQPEYIEQELPFRHKLRVANMDRAIAEMWALYEKETDNKTKKALLDSITDSLLKQAALDGDPMAIERALKAVSKIRKITQNNGESSTSGNSAEGQNEELQQQEQQEVTTD